MLILCSSSSLGFAPDDAQLLWLKEETSGNLTLGITDDDDDGDHVPAMDRPYPEKKQIIK